MELPTNGKKKYSFPVILGTNPGEPVSTRAARMRIYNDLVSQLDTDNARYAQELSEVDLSDPDDVKIVPNDPEGDVLVHLGSANYLERYKLYMAHLKEWRRQFTKLESVDLRYERQIVVNPDLGGGAKPVALPVAAMKTAMKAGVKPALLVTRSAATPQTAATKSASTTVKPAASRKQLKSAHPQASRSKAKPRVKPVASTKSPVGGVARKSSPKTGTLAKTTKPSPSIPKEKEQEHP
jgi:cell division protein FtsQ